MEWIGQIRLNILAIKLHKDLSLSFLRICYTYRSTGSSGTTTTPHIYKYTVEYRSDGCVLFWRAIYRDCATKQEGGSPFFFFHVWRVQFPCESFATDVPKRTDLMILVVWGGKGSV